MAYTLRDMLNTQAFQELQVIAGKDGLDNPVRYVGVLEAPDSIDFVKEHEFILTTGYVFSLQTDRMMTMIRQLHEHNAAGIGIKMFRYIQSLPEEVRQMADEYKLPIFFIPNKYSWHELILPLILNISAMNAEDGRLYQDYDQLIYNMQHSQTIYDFISRAGELLQKPLTLVNRNTKEFLCYPADYEPEYGPVEQWLAILQERGKEKTGGKVHYFRPERKKQGFLAVELQLQEYQYLILWDSPEPADLNQYNYLVYSLVLISDSMQNRRAMEKNQLLQKSLMLQKIFLEKVPEEAKMASYGVSIGKEDVHIPMVAAFAGHQEERISVYNPVVIRLLEQLLQKWRVHGFTDTDGQIHLLIPVERNLTPPERLSYSRKTASGILKTIQGYFPDLEARAAVGRCGDGWTGLEERHRELLQVWSRVRDRTDLNWPVQLHDLGAEVCLANPGFSQFFQELLEEYFWSVEQLETENREKLESAVRAYLEAGFNTREAARSLGVHHNTIRNRLEQLMTLTGLDLTRKEDLFMILLYFQLK